MSNTREQKEAFWADFDCAVSRVPSSDYLFVLIDANARTGVRMGEKDRKVIGAYGRDTRVCDSNGTSLLRFAGDNKPALVKSFFSVPKECTPRTFNGARPADRERIDCIITRQPHGKACSKRDCSLAAAYEFRPQHRVRQSPDSPADSLVIENSEPAQGARVLTDEQ